MFAGYDASPISSFQYVSLDAAGRRGAHWRPQHLAPVLNHKRLTDGFRACDDDAAGERCAVFRTFAADRAKVLPGPVWNPTTGFGVPQEFFKNPYRRQIELVSHDSWTIRPRSPSSRRLEREFSKIVPEYSS